MTLSSYEQQIQFRLIKRDFFYEQETTDGNVAHLMNIFFFDDCHGSFASSVMLPPNGYGSLSVDTSNDTSGERKNWKQTDRRWH